MTNKGDKMFEKIKKQISDYSYRERMALGISIINIFLFIILTNYHDVDALLRSHIFWDSFFDGSVKHFYDNFTSINIHNCNLLDRFLLLIWYLPSWLLTKLIGCESYTTFYHEMWHKLFLTIMYFLCIKSMIKIAKSLRKEKTIEKYCLLMMSLSPGVVLSVFYAGQDEIVYLTFFMYALQHYVKGNRIKYYFWAILSAICCPLMLLPYLIIIVIDDKNLYSIVGKILLPLIPQWLYNIFFSQCLTYRYTTSGDFVGLFFATNTINLGCGKLSVLAVIFAILFAFAYLYKADLENTEENIKIYIYIVIILFSSLVIIGWDHFYRNLLWIPFAILFIASFGNFINSKICLVIVMVTDILQTIRDMYNINLTNYLDGSRLTVLAHKIFGNIKNERYPLFSDKTGLEVLLLNSLMIACLILFAYFGKKKTCDKLELQIECSSLLFLYSLVLPCLLLYSLMQAFIIN